MDVEVLGTGMQNELQSRILRQLHFDLEGKASCSVEHRFFLR